MIRDTASQNQVNAADPRLNTWLSANAGSGKTRVLTDRVARLLLDGVNPQNILCLTYTKAAASEMQNRLFKRLGSWSMLSDAELRLDLQKLGVDDRSGKISLAQARRLFARAIETPGGLKIQTIHSFCSSVLRRFPLEAGVSPQFIELDETTSRKLQEQTLDDIAEGEDRSAFQGLLRHFSGSDILGLTSNVIKNASYFRGALPEASMRNSLDLSPTTTTKGLLEQIFFPDWSDLLGNLKDALATGSKTDLAAKEKLDDLQNMPQSFDLLSQLEDVFLYGEKSKNPFSAKIDRFPTKAVREENPELIDQVHRFMETVAEARETRLSIVAFERALDLHTFGQVFIDSYEAKKLNMGLLDFDDLIEKTLFLLRDSKVAQWVLYRLDGGIDHLLVDEAQDTSPVQWAVIEALTQEYASGQSARDDIKRTVFVVGDKKQSIYSFQGADPKEFDRMRQHFDNSLTAANDRLETPALQHSFRSSPGVLRVVDQVFQDQKGDAIGGAATHIAFNEKLPGRVDLWPLIEPGEAEDPNEKWYEPIDTLRDTHHDVRLAEQIATEIKRTIRDERLPVLDTDSGEILRRRITEGDFLILVQRRSDLFNEIIRACKTKGLRVAGADRLQLMAEMAVKDICSVLSFLALPEDSLSLAAALKSPLFGWTEQDLYHIAYHRNEDHLWQALRNSEQHPATLAVLNDLRKQSDFLRPYELIERLLTRHDGRSKLLRRLGMEAADGIDALLTQAINYETKGTPSLTGFLCWLESEMTEIKRQSDSQSDEIRVMTVHGAKGLEAPIVILPDTAERRNLIRNDIVKIGDHVHWKPPSVEVPNSLRAGMNEIKQAQENERMRLLYVAMTRAENWLVVCGTGDPKSTKDSWYSDVSAALQHCGPVDAIFGDQMIQRVEFGDWNNGEVVTDPEVDATTNALPVLTEVKQPDENLILSPSDLGGAKALPGEPGEVEHGKARGRAIHYLLEHLAQQPKPERREYADRLLSQYIDGKELGPEEIESVIRILSSDRLRWLFDKNSVEEVPISASLKSLKNRRIHGIIDRLVFKDDVITAVDFKSNRVVPKTSEETPEGILRQIGAYAEALREIYPDKKIETAILWTETAELMRLPDELISNALARVNVP